MNIYIYITTYYYAFKLWVFPGDFAILIQSGMSFRRALSFNFMSACTAFIGLVIGICLGNMEYSGFVFSFAGGLFLFITLTHLVSTLNRYQLCNFYGKRAIRFL